MNTKILFYIIFLLSLVYAQQQSTCPTDQLEFDLLSRGSPPKNTIPVYLSKEFILTKPQNFGEIIPENVNVNPYMGANISEINSINIKNNIYLLGGFSKLFEFSQPYGFAASFSSESSGTTSITATDSYTKVDNPGVLQIKVYSVSPEVNGNSSAVYNARGFPESEFIVQAPMVIHGFYGNFSSNFPLPKITTSFFQDDNYIIASGNVYVTNVVNGLPVGRYLATVSQKGTLVLRKQATLYDFSYVKIPFLALTENIPANVLPMLSLNWRIEPYGTSGSYFIFSPFNVLGQKKEGIVTIRDVAIGLVYSYLTGGLSRKELLSGIKNVIYHTIPIPVEAVGTGNDEAFKAAKCICGALSSYSQSQSNNFEKAKNNFEKAKEIVDAILDIPLRQRYLVDPFVFNGSEMLIASYLNSSANPQYCKIESAGQQQVVVYFYSDADCNQLLYTYPYSIPPSSNYEQDKCEQLSSNQICADAWQALLQQIQTQIAQPQYQLYELWYINTTTYDNPQLYYRDSFQTNLLAVGGTNNKVYTLEYTLEGDNNKYKKYKLTTYEIIPMGYKMPSLQLPEYLEQRYDINPMPSSQDEQKNWEKVERINDWKINGYESFNNSWASFFGQTIYEETHDLYKIKEVELSKCAQPISFAVEQYGKAYVLCFKSLAYLSGYNYISGYFPISSMIIFDSNGNSYSFSSWEGISQPKIAISNGLVFIGTGDGEIRTFSLGNPLSEQGSPILINFTDLNISSYAQYAYNKKCDLVQDKAYYHKILAMEVRDNFIYLVDLWQPRGCDIREVRLRIFPLGSINEITIAPFNQEDRIGCFKDNSCGKKAIAPPYGWVLASNRPDNSKFTFYPQSTNDKFGFPEIGAPIGDNYSVNMSIDDFGKIYLVTASSGGKSIAILDLQPFNYTLQTFGAGSLYACFSPSGEPSGEKIIIEKGGKEVRAITQSSKCSSSAAANNIIYLYGAPNVINYLDKSFSYPLGYFYASPIGITSNQAIIQQGLNTASPSNLARIQPLTPQSVLLTQLNLSSSISGKIVLPFYSIYFFNQTADITNLQWVFSQNLAEYKFDSYSCKQEDIQNWLLKSYPDYFKPQPYKEYYPGRQERKMLGKLLFSEASFDVSSKPLSTKFESTNMMFIITTLVNGLPLPAFLYQKTLPEQLVSISLFNITGIGSKGFGEVYLNVTPTSPYGEPPNSEASVIAKRRNFDFYTTVWKYKDKSTGEEIILNATGTLKPTSDTSLLQDYYFTPLLKEPPLQASVNLAISSPQSSFSFTYLPVPTFILNKKVPLNVIVQNLFSLGANDSFLGKRTLNITFVDLFNSTFTLPMKLDFAYATKINATITTEIDKSDTNLTHVTIKGNLSKITRGKDNKFNYDPLEGDIYIYVDRNINYCNELCSKSLAEEDPTEAIRCSLNLNKDYCLRTLAKANPIEAVLSSFKGDCLLANPLNFSRTGESMQRVAGVINYKTESKDEKEKVCNIYDDTYPKECPKDPQEYTKSFYCVPIYENGTGYCTSQVGLVNVSHASNGNFEYKFDIRGFGLGKKIILQYYGYPSFAKTQNGYVENYAYMPTTTILSFNYGVLPLDFGEISSLIAITLITLVVLFFVFQRKIFI